MDIPVARIIGRVTELYEGQPQWEVEVDGECYYLTMAELRELARDRAALSREEQKSDT